MSRFIVKGVRHFSSCLDLQCRFPPVNFICLPMTTKELSALPAAKPRFIEPMYISEVRELPDGAEWAYEAKLDGYRCKNGRITLWSRRRSS
jgi:hypothetical protein